MGRKQTAKQLKRLPETEKQAIYEDCSDVPTTPYIQTSNRSKMLVNTETEHSRGNLEPESQNKTKKIEKIRKKRTFDPQARFLREHQKRFFLFPFLYATSFPFMKISWENWKPTGYFGKMSEFLSNISPKIPNKTPDQCKSYDERQKKEIYKNVDLLQAAFTEIQKHQMDPNSLKICSDFIDTMEQPSEYMTFLAQNQLHPNPPAAQKRYAPYPSEESQPFSNEFLDQDQMNLSAGVLS